ncbi:MAG TPA: tetratricopeptide repeat protein [Burkholderiaceae bacterium]
MAARKPSHAKALHDALRQAIGALREERLDEAELALSDLLRRWPGQPDALHFLGVLRHVQGRTSEGVALIRQALQQVPGHVGAWNNLGNVLLESQQLTEAIDAYRSGVAAAPTDPAAADALSNLAVVHRKLLQWRESEAACREALALRPDFVEAWYNLSLALMGQGKLHDGLLANSKAITLSPRHLQAREQVIRALMLQGEREQAALLYREWLAEDPDNPVARHQLAACLNENQPERASDAYIELMFDSFAGSFDAKLEKLGYRAPQLVVDALRQVAGAPQAALDIVDVGCGTGLCGPLLRPWARRLAGCDLSVGMLRQARSRGVYDQLHKAELVYYMDTQPAQFDAVVSADTLCYFGALQAPVAAAKRCLRSGGWLIFTVEALPDRDATPHRLQASGRYSHGSAYLRATLTDAGFHEVELRAEVLRQEASLPVAGWLVTARRE